MRALLSVYNKEGIIEFAQGLTELGWELISTGGTLKFSAAVSKRSTQSFTAAF